MELRGLGPHAHWGSFPHPCRNPTARSAHGSEFAAFPAWYGNCKTVEQGYFG